MGAECVARHQRGEVVDVHGGPGDAGKLALRTIETARQDDDVVVADAPVHRFGDEQALLRMGAQAEEVVAVGETEVVAALHAIAQDGQPVGVGNAQRFDEGQAGLLALQQRQHGAVVQPLGGQFALQFVGHGLQAQVDLEHAAGDGLVERAGNVLRHHLGALDLLLAAVEERVAQGRQHQGVGGHQQQQQGALRLGEGHGVSGEWA